MEELPGNPYSFKGADKYFNNIDSKRKAFYDGMLKIYLRKELSEIVRYVMIKLMKDM